MHTFRDVSRLLAAALALPACSIDAGGVRTSAVEESSNADDGDSDDPVGTDDDADGTGEDAGSKRDGAGSRSCDQGLAIVVRDFTEAHPDFEKFTAAMQGIVESELGDDMKPVYASSGPTVCTTGPAQFAQWFNDVDGVNQRLSYTLEFSEERPGVFVFDSAAFFPIDGQGFGNGPKGGIELPFLGNIGGTTPVHNFLFTTEAHLKFAYAGGEQFTVRGDDDLWVFINRKLALDLGGTHAAQTATVDLDAQADALGLEKGESYSMDIFHAERHTTESNFRIETTIDLSCVENVPVI